MQSEAIAPVLLLLVKQIVKDAAQSMLKDMVLSSLNGMGCRGMAIANALQALDLRKGPSGAGGVMGLLGGGMPKMPAGMPGMPAGMAMPQMPGMAGMGIPGMAGGFPGMGGLPGTALGMGGAEGDMMARMRTMMPGVGETPAGTGIDPEQMARVMQSMSQPLSPRG